MWTSEIAFCVGRGRFLGLYTDCFLRWEMIARLVAFMGLDHHSNHFWVRADGRQLLVYSSSYRLGREEE